MREKKYPSQIRRPAELRELRKVQPERMRAIDRARKNRKGSQLRTEARHYVRDCLQFDPCAYCGRKAEHIDHIDAVARGGTAAWDNLAAACGGCNREKHSHVLVVWLARRSRS